MRCFAATLGLVEKINEEAASSCSGSARGALIVIYLDIAALSSAEEQDKLLHMETAA